MTNTEYRGAAAWLLLALAALIPLIAYYLRREGYMLRRARSCPGALERLHAYARSYRRESLRVYSRSTLARLRGCRGEARDLLRWSLRAARRARLLEHYVARLHGAPLASLPSWGPR